MKRFWVALWEFALRLVCSDVFPTVEGRRRPLCFFNALGRIGLSLLARVGRAWPALRLFEIVHLDAPPPPAALVARVERLFARLRTESGTSLSPIWRDALDTFERGLSAEALRTFRRTSIGDSGYMGSGLIGSNWSRALTVVQTYHRFARLAHPLRLATVSEHAAGSITAVSYRGRLLSYNLVRHAMFAGRIAAHVRLDRKMTIVEIGGGYGSLARLLKSESPASTIVLVDIPSSLALALYFLATACPNARIASVEAFPAEGPLDVTGYDFVLLPATWLPRLSDASVDLVINTASFQEMPFETIQRYFEHIQRFCRGYLYCYNRLHTPASYGGVSFSQYPFDQHWRPVSQSISPEGLFEWIGRRTWRGTTDAAARHLDRHLDAPRMPVAAG